MRDWCLVAVCSLLAWPAAAGQSTPAPPAAQSDDRQQPPVDHSKMDMGDAGWHWMQDAVLFVVYDDQGGPRGGREFNSPNWWMAQASHAAGAGSIAFNVMLSLDPLTVGKSGYREIFQVGEALDGRPVVDRQHPHDLLMQLSLAWRLPLTDRTSLTFAGGPVGEPALGPTAFMHRASAAENPTAPLGHHTLDSTHIAMGVVSAALDRGRFTVESSLFNAREPDDNRWDLMDPGALDSWSVRGWFRPNDEWELQASTGHLREPEQLEPGDIQRTTLSASWLRQHASGFSAVTVAYGRNNKSHDDANAFLAESTISRGSNALYGRVEATQVETALLVPAVPVAPPAMDLGVDRVFAATLGGVHDLWTARGTTFGLGADVTFYGVPDALRESHGSHPVSFHVFFRLRPPASPMGRMWNMRMTKTH